MIYFAKMDSHSFVKIGWSNTVAGVPWRLSALQDGNPFRLRLIREVNGPKWGEAWFHQRFSDLWMLREWYKFDPLMMILELPAIKPTDMNSSRSYRSESLCSPYWNVDYWRQDSAP